MELIRTWFDGTTILRTINSHITINALLELGHEEIPRLDGINFKEINGSIFMSKEGFIDTIMSDTTKEYPAELYKIICQYQRKLLDAERQKTRRFVNQYRGAIVFYVINLGQNKYKVGYTDNIEAELSVGFLSNIWQLHSFVFGRSILMNVKMGSPACMTEKNNMCFIWNDITYLKNVETIRTLIDNYDFTYIRTSLDEIKSRLTH